VQAIQAVLDEVHPGTDYQVQWGDKICDRRIRGRRSKIVQAGVDAVDALYKSKTYLDNPSVIRAHVKYALRVDGPAFFKVPIPENCPYNPTAAGYIVRDFTQA
ncbi:hypothetical protein B0H12DRAFT_1032086, partial [Mycena haematopus]